MTDAGSLCGPAASLSPVPAPERALKHVSAKEFPSPVGAQPGRARDPPAGVMLVEVETLALGGRHALALDSGRSRRTYPGGLSLRGASQLHELADQVLLHVGRGRHGGGGRGGGSEGRRASVAQARGCEVAKRNADPGSAVGSCSGRGRGRGRGVGWTAASLSYGRAVQSR